MYDYKHNNIRSIKVLENEIDIDSATNQERRITSTTSTSLPTTTTTTKTSSSGSTDQNSMATASSGVEGGISGNTSAPTASFSGDANILSEIELEWAKEIKDKVMNENPASAQQFSDLEFAQLAIVTKGKLNRAMKMLHRLHEFKQEYNIPIIGSTNEIMIPTSMAQQAMEIITEFEKGSPGFLLSFGNDVETGKYVSVWNYSAFTPRSYKSLEDWKTLFAAFYYLCEASTPDIHAIRSGMVILCDCDDMGFRNFSLQVEKHGASLFQDCYPIRTKEMTLFNTPIIVKIMYTLCKPFLTKHSKEIFNMNGSIEEIQQRYPKNILPKQFGGTQGKWDMNDKLLKALQKRYETKQTFTLQDKGKVVEEKVTS